MIKTLLSFCLVLFIACTVSAQPCTVNITGASCINNALTANVTGGDLGKLVWTQYTNTYYRADTVSSPASITLVAGGHGRGFAPNQIEFASGGVAVDDAGNVYVADYGNNRVQKWAPGATVGVTVAGGYGPGSAAYQLSGPIDVAVDKDGNVYVADNLNNRVQKWAPGATSGVTVAGGHGGGPAANQFNGVFSIYLDKDLTLYVADPGNYRIQKWKKGAAKGVTVAGGNGRGTAANQFTRPEGVGLDSAGNIYVSDINTENAEQHRVQKWAPGATAGVTVIGGHGVGTNADQLGFLLGMTVTAAGDIYVADNGVDGAPIGRIQKWAAGATTGVTVAGGPTDGWDALIYPGAVTLDKNGNIYVYDGSYNPRVQKYVPTNGVVNSKFSPTYPGPYVATATFKNGCVASSDSKVVFQKPETPMISTTLPSGRGGLCGGGQFTFSVYKWDTSTVYTWKVPNSVTVAANKNDTITLNVPASFKSGALITHGENVCGVSTPDTLVLTAKPAAPLGFTGPRHVAANQPGLVYSIEDAGAVNTWKVPAGAQITSGQGTTSITVTWGTTEGNVSVNAGNDCGTSGYKNVYVYLKGSPHLAAGLESQDDAKANAYTNSPVVYPNPASNTASVLLDVKKQGKYLFEVQDMTGKKLMQKEQLLAQGTNKIAIDISKYAKGMYIITVTGGNSKPFSLKLLKQ